MISRAKGTSLAEVLIATAITAGLCAVLFELFRQNERVFRDQSLLLEMQQSVRAATAQITDDIRIAGQGVPVHLTEVSEGTAVVLAGSDASRLRFRAGYSNAESRVTSPLPVYLSIGSPVDLAVESPVAFSSVVGSSPSGRYAYLWGESDLGQVWVRAALESVGGASKTIRITPEESNVQPVRFTAAPVLSLEEAVAIYFDGAARSIRRTTATDMADPANPRWAPANEIASNITEFTISYYDVFGMAVVPDEPTRRLQVARVDLRVVGRTAAALSDGSRPAYALTVRSFPRNLRGR
jgi:hypothetical protein